MSRAEHPAQRAHDRVADGLDELWVVEHATASAAAAEERFWRTCTICVAVFTGVMVAGTVYVLAGIR